MATAHTPSRGLCVGACLCGASRIITKMKIKVSWKWVKNDRVKKTSWPWNLKVKMAHWYTQTKKKRPISTLLYLSIQLRCCNKNKNQNVVFVAVFLGCTSTGRVGLCFLWFYVQELPKAQPAVVLVLKRLRRRGNGLKSHPTDWEKPGIER